MYQVQRHPNAVKIKDLFSTPQDTSRSLSCIVVEICNTARAFSPPTTKAVNES